jgi:catechol 2,3-dioxygenase-like lactoylglutathione lyase family enzyme
MFKIETLHHVSMPISCVDKAKHFYGCVLKLREIKRPDALSKKLEGAWYEVGDRTLHLIKDEASTFRKDAEGKAKPISSRDIHFAIRVESFRATFCYLKEQGYSPSAEEANFVMKINAKGDAGFSQIYIMDPDSNVIEFNAVELDMDEADIK